MLIMKRLFVIAGALTEDGDRPDRAVQMQEGTAVFDSQDVVGECKKLTDSIFLRFQRFRPCVYLPAECS